MTDQTEIQRQKGLESLKLRQKAVDFAVLVCKEILLMLPVEEKWVLSSQLCRSVQSIPANIAEGFGRFYYQETIHFCYIARGSLNGSTSYRFIF
jgi:four helix bundle protein